MSIRQQVYQKLLSKAPLTKEDIAELTVWCEEKPLFAAAQMLLLNALKTNADHRFQARQKKAALVCPSREALFNYLNPVDVLEPAKPSLDFTPPKKSETKEGKKTEAGLENKEEKKAVEKEKANTSATTKEEAAKKTSQELETNASVKAPQKPLTQKEVVKEETSNSKQPDTTSTQEKTLSKEAPKAETTAKSKDTKDAKPVTSKPVTEKTKSDSSNDWQARIAALKAKSEAIIAKTKDVAKDEETTNPQQHTDESISKDSEINTVEEKAVEQPIEVTENNDVVKTQIEESGKSPIQEEHVEETAVDKNEKEAIETAPTEAVEEMPLKEEVAGVDSVTPSREVTPLSFNDWLQKLNKKNEPIDAPEEVSSEQQEEKREKWQRVDAFLQKLPEITPPRRPMLDERPSSPVAFSKEPLDDNELITETLARLYVDQGLIDKAIEAYEILQLNIPEKSQLFKRQIQSLREKGKR